MIKARYGHEWDGSCNARHDGCMHDAALVFTLAHMIVRLCVPCFLRIRDEGDMLLAQAFPSSKAP